MKMNVWHLPLQIMNCVPGEYEFIVLSFESSPPRPGTALNGGRPSLQWRTRGERVEGEEGRRRRGREQRKSEYNTYRVHPPLSVSLRYLERTVAFVPGIGCPRAEENSVCLGLGLGSKQERERERDFEGERGETGLAGVRANPCAFVVQ